MSTYSKLAYAIIGVAVAVILASGHASYERSKATEVRMEHIPSSDKLVFTEGQLADLPIKALNLTKSNTVIFRGEVNAFSVAAAEQELSVKDKAMPYGGELYLYLNTPGGGVDAGIHLINYAKSLKHPVNTVTFFAASMGFFTVEGLATRYILPSGTLMAHRVRLGGLGGQIPGEMISELQFIYTSTTRLEHMGAERLKMPFDKYRALSRDEYWMDGVSAVQDNAADSLASISCDASLDGTSTTEMQTFFGAISVIWSNCPAVSFPIGIAGGAEMTPEQRGIIQGALNSPVEFHRLFKNDVLNVVNSQGSNNGAGYGPSPL